MAKYIIRDASDDDIQGIAALRTGIKEFIPIKAAEFISIWKYLIKNNPCRIQKALVAVDNREKIVAHYAIVPFRFLKEGEQLLGGFLCQLMIDEDFRQELIFPRMEMKFINGYKKLGYDFAFSLGNREHVVKAHLSFGFLKIGDLPVYARPYKLSKIAPHIIKNKALTILARPALFVMEKIMRFKRPSGSDGLTVKEISRFDPDIDLFFSNVRKHFPYCATRDAEALNWRFADSHKDRYRILTVTEENATIGYAVLRRMKMKQFDVLAVVDILFSPERPDAGMSLFRAIHDTAVTMDIDMSSCMLNEQDPLCRHLKKAGYLKTPETFSLFVHEPKGTTHCFSADTFDKWHLTWFDNDAL